VVAEKQRSREAHTPYSYISMVDTTQSKKILDLKIDANWLEGLALERAGSRLFVSITAENVVGVIDQNQHSITAGGLSRLTHSRIFHCCFMTRITVCC